MNNFFTLCKALLKNTSWGFGKQKKLTSIILFIIIGLCFLPLLYSLYEVFNIGFEFTHSFNQNITLFNLTFQTCCLLIFTFGIFIIPSVYYFGEDIETLLRLPLKPQEIIASKLVQCVIYEYLFVFLLGAPLMVAYFVSFGFSIITLLFFLLVSVLLPLYPLILCSIIVMFLMRFTPFFKNRDRFQLIGGFVGVILGLGLSLGLNQIFQPHSQSEIIYMFVSGDHSLSTIFTCLFPTIPFASKAIVEHNLFDLLIFIGLQIITIYIFLCLAKGLYFKGVIGIQQTSAKKTSLKKAKQQVSIPFISLLKKEIIILIKTPTYALNCVGMIVIFPISLLFGLFSGGDLDFSYFSNVTFTRLEGLMMIIGLCCGLFFASFNQTSSTALSREGSNYVFMKYIPIPYRTQFLAKVSTGIIFSSIMLIITFIIFFYIFPYLPIHYNLLLIFTSFLSTIWFNFIALMIDFLFPKLHWDTEAEAVKQNFISAITMILAIAISALLIIGLFFINSDWWIYIAIGIIAMMFISFFIIYRYLERFCRYCLNKIN